MFGGGRGPWRDDPPWTGWWGEDPPYHAPVFVLTHHPREPVEMQGGTTFHFVTDGLDAAFDRAEEAAGGKDILIAGGANVIRQSLAAGRVDGFWLHLAPIVLGAGERPLDDVGTLRLEQVRAVDAPGVTHIEYRVLR
jgi:dihydrofolate reductase